MKTKVYAIDFDGTLCENAWPDIGSPHRDMIEWAKNVKRMGDKIILWTCRDNMQLVDAIVWCADQGLFFDAINDNLDEHVQRYGNNCRKIFADCYIDDKAVYPIIIERKNYDERTD